MSYPRAELEGIWYIQPVPNGKHSLVQFFFAPNAFYWGLKDMMAEHYKLLLSTITIIPLIMCLVSDFWEEAPSKS